MSEQTQLMSEGWAVVAAIDPDVTAASTVLSGAVDMASYSRVMVIGQAGTLGASATLDLKVTQATTAAGTYKDVTGAAITQLTQASPDDSDQQVIINVDQTDLDIDNDYRYIKASLTIATATSDAAAIVLGLPKRRPASGSDAASVAEIIS